VDLPAARFPTEKAICGRAIPVPLGSHVPGRRRLLELRRGRDLRLLDQLADCVLLRDRNRPDGEPRSRSHDGRLRHAGGRTRHVRPPLSDSAGEVAREARSDLLLESQHRARLDGLLHPVAAGGAAVVRLGERGLLRGAFTRLPDDARQPPAGVGPDARRPDLHHRRRAAIPVDCLAGAALLRLARNSSITAWRGFWAPAFRSCVSTKSVARRR
jgi:hypothetical protein